MKLNKINITNEMVEHYKNRTIKHINCVKRNANHLAKKCPKIADRLIEQCSFHDNSKLREPEYTPYIFITWNYKCKDDGINFTMPNNINDQKATFNHVVSNMHHPEYWDDAYDINCINAKDRDKKSNYFVNATEMDLISLAEMICDWHAMGLERGNTAKQWADDNVNLRWKFNDDQVFDIYNFISLLEDQTEF